MDNSRRDFFYPDMPLEGQYHILDQFDQLNQLWTLRAASRYHQTLVNQYLGIFTTAPTGEGTSCDVDTSLLNRRQIYPYLFVNWIKAKPIDQMRRYRQVFGLVRRIQLAATKTFYPTFKTDFTDFNQHILKLCRTITEICVNNHPVNKAEIHNIISSLKSNPPHPHANKNPVESVAAEPNLASAVTESAPQNLELKALKTEILKFDRFNIDLAIEIFQKAFQNFEQSTFPAAEVLTLTHIIQSYHEQNIQTYAAALPQDKRFLLQRLRGLPILHLSIRCEVSSEVLSNQIILEDIKNVPSTVLFKACTSKNVQIKEGEKKFSSLYPLNAVKPCWLWNLDFNIEGKFNGRAFLNTLAYCHIAFEDDVDRYQAFIKVINAIADKLEHIEYIWKLPTEELEEFLNLFWICPLYLYHELACILEDELCSEYYEALIKSFIDRVIHKMINHYPKSIFIQNYYDQFPMREIAENFFTDLNEDQTNALFAKVFDVNFMTREEWGMVNSYEMPLFEMFLQMSAPQVQQETLEAVLKKRNVKENTILHLLIGVELAPQDHSNQFPSDPYNLVEQLLKMYSENLTEVGAFILEMPNRLGQTLVDVAKEKCSSERGKALFDKLTAYCEAYNYNPSRFAPSSSRAAKRQRIT